MRLHTSFQWVSLLLALACNGKDAKYASGPSCEQRQAQLVSVVKSLPEVVIAGPSHVALPQASLAGAYGQGTLLELDEPLVVFNGIKLVGNTQAERAEQLRAAALALPISQSSKPLYVAAQAGTDIRSLNTYLSVLPEPFDIHLTFVRPPTETSEDSSAYADKLLLERNPQARRRIAMEGYDEYSDCEVLDTALTTLEAEPETTRFGKLKAAIENTVPQCRCSDIDPDGLRLLVAAEQRAGNVAIGSSPGNFLRDVRCRASMPLRSVQQVLTDMERFEDEFSGSWDSTGLTFEQVVTNDRLLNYLCGAMPGEIYEAISADFASLFVRAATTPGCREFRLEPVARGAVFGTLRAVDNPDQSFHYRLGGNDLRLFGPLPSAESSPTDGGPWACDKEHKLSASDATSLQVESGGRLFFTRSACEQAKGEDASLTTCAFDPNLLPAVAPPLASDSRAANTTAPSATTDSTAAQ
jgi:hypothetical protein